MKRLVFLVITLLFCSIIVSYSSDFKWIKLNGPKIIINDTSYFFQNIWTLAENSQGVIYAANSSAGIFSTSDNGSTWLKVETFPKNVDANDMVISPNDYIYTGSNFDGLWRSTDNGLTWDMPNKDILVKNFGVHLLTHDRGLSSTANNILFIPTTVGLLRSKNFGVDWEKCEPTSTSLTPAVTISSTDEIYTITPTSDNQLSIFSSTDYGDTWEFKCIIPAQIPSFIKAKNDTLFFGSEDTTNGGVFRSTDKGLTWTLVIKENKTNFYNAAFADDGTIYFGTYGKGMYRLNSDGKTWDIINDGLEVKDYFIPSSLINKDGYIFIGTPYSGVYRSCLPVNQSEYTHIEAEGPNPNCDNIPVLLKATPEGDSYHYLWSTGETTPQILADTTGTYILEVTYDFGCTSKDTVFVKVEPKFEAGITGDSVLCNGEVITLTGEPFNASYKFQWSTGETLPLIKVNKPGIITLIVTNPAGCADTVTKEIKDGLMGFAIKGTLEFCEGQTNILTAPLSGNAYKYLWSTGETTESITVKNSGKYWLKIEDNQGCKGWDTVDVIVFPKITASIFPNVKPVQFCEGDSLKLTAQPIENGMTYLWSNGEITPEIYVSKEGDYSVKVISINGCSDSAKISVQMNPKPEVKIIGNSVICENETAELSADKDYTTYLWSSGETTKAITINDKGNYWLKATNEFGCSDSTSITIKTTPKPKAEIEIQASNPLCDGETAILSSKLDFDKYLWSTGEQSKSISIQNSGYYSLKVLNEFGCSDTVGTFLSFQPNIHFWLDTVNASIGNDKVFFSLKGKYENEIPLSINQMNVKIKFDKTCFFPNKSQMFTIIENNTIGDNRFFNFQLDNIELTKSPSLLAKIEGMTLLGNKQVNELSIEEVIIPNGGFCIDKKPGVLILDSVCVFNLRKITFFNQDILSISPNPANTELKIEMLKGDKMQSITIYSMTGRNEFSMGNLNDSKMKIDISNLQNGKYILEIRTNKAKFTESFMIVK